MKSYAEYCPLLRPGDHVQGTALPEYASIWAIADAGCFDAVEPRRNGLPLHVVMTMSSASVAAAA